MSFDWESDEKLWMLVNFITPTHLNMKMSNEKKIGWFPPNFDDVLDNKV